MALQYSYPSFPTSAPKSPAQTGSRHRPVFGIWVTGPSGTMPMDGCIDSASDDTIFPKYLADLLDIDLSNAQQGSSNPVGGIPISYRLVQVTLRICDGREECRWDTTVGFIDKPLRWALLGHAGFLDFFTTELRGDVQQAVFTPNTNFTGRHTVFQTP